MVREFWGNRGKNGVNTSVFTSILTMSERKLTIQKMVRIYLTHSKEKDVSKTAKIVLIIISIAVAFIIGTCLFIGAIWGGAFNFIQSKEIGTYNSPDGEYSLVFEQMGDPQWPFGPTDVRLTLKNYEGEIIERVSTQLRDDGANASEHNIVSVSWNDDAVIVVLRASEMKDKEVSIAYNKS